MANTFINRIVTVTTSYVALSAKSEVAHVTLSCRPDNAGDVNFLGDDEVTDVPWVASEWHTFRDIDLSKIFIKGTADDKVTIVGYSGSQ